LQPCPGLRKLIDREMFVDGMVADDEQKGKQDQEKDG
jgi:hypothetical protein